MSTSPQDPTPGTPPDQPPLGSWGRMYALVLSVLVLEIVLFTIFTKVFE